jgi:hypothetical protein
VFFNKFQAGLVLLVAGSNPVWEKTLSTKEE